MKTIKLVLMSFIGVTFVLFSLVVAVFATIFTTPNGLSFLLRQVWKDVPEGYPQAYYDVEESLAFELDLTYPSKYGENQYGIIRPKAEGTYPVVLWVHGGAFVSGSKDSIRVFGALLAAEGYTVVLMNYEVSPENNYPSALIQVNEMMEHIFDVIGKKMYVDDSKIVIGGDSAGAHIAANYALIQTNPFVSENLGIPKNERLNLAGLLLYCGPYDLEAFDQMITRRLRSENESNPLAGILDFFIDQVGWSYLGYKDWKNSPYIDYTNIVNLVTSDFPASYITDANTVSFMEHGISLASKLQNQLGVDVTTYFPSMIYDKDYVHEYQFDFIENEVEAFQNLELTVQFLEQVFA